MNPLNIFLEPLTHNAGYRELQAAAYVMDILANRISSYKLLAEKHSEKLPDVKRSIVLANRKLNTGGLSIESIRTAYIDFLEEEIKILNFDPTESEGS